jgi:DNA-binding NtrC family response regulator
VTPSLGALAWSALGRALLRVDHADAAKAFESASVLRGARPAVGPVARLGLALARGARRGDPEVVEAIADLERWGDRRLVAEGLADVRHACGDVAEPGALPAARVEASRTCPTVTALADAVEALQGDGSWPARWLAAMEAVQPALPWFRAAWVADDAGLLARRGEGAASPLDGEDVARAVAQGATQLSIFRVDEHGALRCHPTAALHGLETAAIAPTAGGHALYVDVRPGDGVLGPEALGLLLRLARIMVRHADGDPVRPEMRSVAAFPEIVGRSVPMEALFEQMRRVARSEASVHIFGATGTGKERVASSLHRHSPRSAGPFVAVNASSLSDDLFESEMFGHVKGAFTGAVGDRKGHVMAAEGGTLFIDEVADLTPRAQAKLLRFLQDGEYRRVGEAEARVSNVRVLTAANVRLAERASAGLFRQDLMYRLVALTIELPTLRERGQDVALLARHFLRSEAAREGRPAPALPGEVARALVAYGWPGNVRELQNEMRRLVVLAGPGPIRVEHLSPRVAGRASPPSRMLSDARTAVERDLIAQTLPMYDGNRSRAACALGISRQALVTKIRQLGL